MNIKDIGPNLTQGLWGIYLLLQMWSAPPDSMWVGTNAQLTVNAPLPIKLSDFYGKENSNIIELFWATSSESNKLIISKSKLEVMVQILFRH